MLKNNKILVIGDIMLDIYYSGEINRISPEAPVPVFKKISEKYVLGGASNVVANLSAANQTVSILSLVGEDENGHRLKGLLKEIRADISLLKTWERPTITKTRFLAENNQQVLRVDVEDSRPVVEASFGMLDSFRENVDLYDLILISDYMKGILTYEFTQGVINIAKAHGKKVLIDVKDPNFNKYKGAWLLKPNLKELSVLTKMSISSDAELIEAAKFLQKEADCKYVLTTCGAKGMLLVGEDIVYHLGTVGQFVYDVTGAGDTTIAYLAASLASGLDIVEAMKLSNFAAGIQVGKVGTSAVYLHEVEEVIQSGGGYRRKKVFHMNERGAMAELLTQWKNAGETIVTTNGCFDIIHRGHISLLEEAKTYGDHLVVLVNTDASVKRLKGENRPINAEEDRVAVIAALDCVDAVMLFDPLIDNTVINTEEIDKLTPEIQKVACEAPMGAIKFIAPDVHIKGGDYTSEQVPEAIFAKEFHAVPFVEGYSTTRTIEKTQIK